MVPSVTEKYGINFLICRMLTNIYLDLKDIM